MSNSVWWLVPALAVGIAAVIYLARRRNPPATVLPTSVEVRYTSHARRRMSERGITQAQVAAVLADPARNHRDRAENSVRLERDFTDRTLKVWVAEPWPAAHEVVIKSTAWKYVTTLTIPTGMVRRVIGTKGATIQAIRERTGAAVSIRSDGTVHISAGDRASADAAQAQIHALTTVAPCRRPKAPERR